MAKTVQVIDPDGYAASQAFRPYWVNDKPYASKKAYKAGSAPLCMQMCPNCGGCCRVGEQLANSLAQKGEPVIHICADCSNQWTERAS